MKKYIEIRRHDNDEVIHRVDVTGRSDRSIERVDDGMNINLNHSEYYTNIAEYEGEQVLNVAYNGSGSCRRAVQFAWRQLTCSAPCFLRVLGQ